MSRTFFVGYHGMAKTVYLNDHGNKLIDKNAVFVCGEEELPDLVRYLAENYELKKGVINTDLPEKLASRLESLVHFDTKLRKMSITKLNDNF